MTLGIATLSIVCHYDCPDYLNVMLNVIMPIVVTLSIVAPIFNLMPISNEMF